MLCARCRPSNPFFFIFRFCALHAYLGFVIAVHYVMSASVGHFSTAKLTNRMDKMIFQREIRRKHKNDEKKTRRYLIRFKLYAPSENYSVLHTHSAHISTTGIGRSVECSTFCGVRREEKPEKRRGQKFIQKNNLKALSGQRQMAK